VCFNIMTCDCDVNNTRHCMAYWLAGLSHALVLEIKRNIVSVILYCACLWSTGPHTVILFNTRIKAHCCSHTMGSSLYLLD